MYFVPDLVKCQIQMKNLNVTMLYIKRDLAGFSKHVTSCLSSDCMRSRSSENASRREGEDIENVQKAILQAWWMSLTEICLVKQLHLIW